MRVAHGVGGFQGSNDKTAGIRSVSLIVFVRFWKHVLVPASHIKTSAINVWGSFTTVLKVGPDSSLLDGYAYTEAWRSCHVSVSSIPSRPSRAEVFPRVVARLGQEYRLTQTCYRNLAVRCTGYTPKMSDYIRWGWQTADGDEQQNATAMGQSRLGIKEAWKTPGRMGTMAPRIYTRKCRALRGENWGNIEIIITAKVSVWIWNAWSMNIYEIHSEAACIPAQQVLGRFLGSPRWAVLGPWRTGVSVDASESVK